MPQRDLSAMRKDYQHDQLLESSVDPNPIAQFEAWFKEAVVREGQEANVTTLATLDEDNIPEGRIVLLKFYSGDGFVFYTNYNSNKAQQLYKHPYASMTFYWRSMERQVRIKGKISKVDPIISDVYFSERPLGNRIGAWASPQSEQIPDRNYLEARVAEIKSRFPDENNIPRPDFWGGFILDPIKIEFWQGRASRLHDRLVYEKEAGDWKIKRLAP